MFWFRNKKKIILLRIFNKRHLSQEHWTHGVAVFVWITLCLKCDNNTRLGLDTTKAVFGVSDKPKLKPVSSSTETSQKIEISLVASLDMILSKKRITKALISLCGCAGWSAPSLFANPWWQIFSHWCPFNNTFLYKCLVNTTENLFI